MTTPDDEDRIADLRDWVAEGEVPDGAEVLDRVEAWFRRFIRATFPEDIAVLALWVVHTHLATELRTTPRLRLDSITPESGKSTVMDHLKRLCFDALMAASVGSTALLPRVIHDSPRTILMDEVDRNLDPSNPGVGELIAILNSGYRLGSTRPVLVPGKGGTWEVSEMSTFAPVAMAGNSPNLPADTRSREILILLMPDLEGEVEDSDWEYIEAEAKSVQNQVIAFADSIREAVQGLMVDLPPGCVGRMKEKWRPLMRVATMAGGDWPERTTRLIARDVEQQRAARADGLRAMPPRWVFLTDLYKVWPKDVMDNQVVPTSALVDALVLRNMDYWGPSSPYGKRLTETRFGRLAEESTRATSLDAGGERGQTSLRRGGGGPRGFSREQFIPTWTRLGLLPRGGEPGQPGTSGTDPLPFDSPAGSGVPGSPGYPTRRGGVPGSPDDDTLNGFLDSPIPEDDQPANMLCECSGCGDHPGTACVNRLIDPLARTQRRCKPCRERRGAGL